MNANGRTRIMVSGFISAINNPANYQRWLAKEYWPAKEKRKDAEFGRSWQ